MKDARITTVVLRVLCALAPLTARQPCDVGTVISNLQVRKQGHRKQRPSLTRKSKSKAYVLLH